METEPQIENTDVQIREEHKIWHKKILNIMRENVINYDLFNWCVSFNLNQTVFQFNSISRLFCVNYIEYINYESAFV